MLARAIDSNDLERKIKTSTDFSNSERRLILTALDLGNIRRFEHVYPVGHGPSSSSYAAIAWGIIDRLSPPTLSTRDRFMLGARFADALEQVHRFKAPSHTFRGNSR